MKCDKWSEEAPTSIVDQVIEFFADKTCNNFKITKVQKDSEGNEVTLYCHPKTFDYKCTDITQELADKKAKEEKDKSDLEALQEKYNDGTIKLDELVQFLKLKGI